MTFGSAKTLALAMALGSMTATTLPARAAPAETQGAAPLVLVASGGWAARASGHRRTYDPPYGGYGYGYGYGGYDQDAYRQPYYAPRGYPAQGYGAYDDSYDDAY